MRACIAKVKRSVRVRGRGNHPSRCRVFGLVVAVAVGEGRRIGRQRVDEACLFFL